MANLSYNTNIFTNVNKYDETHDYRGILVTGKFNQKNGQDFKILDVIDIDWDGAYVKKFNTYLHTTEDLINVLNLIGDNTTDINNYINDNFVTFSYLSNNHYNKNKIDEKIDDKAEEVIDQILGGVNEQYNTLQKISQWIIDKSRYIKTDYINIVRDGHIISNKDYYIYLGENQYQKVTSEYILNNPYDDYYEFMFSDVIDLSFELQELRNKIGEEKYNSEDNTFTYTGIYANIHIIDNNVTYLSNFVDKIEEKLDITYETANESYYLAYNAYNTSNINKEIIGTNSRLNIYEKIETWDENILNKIENNENKVWVYDEDNEIYYQTTYNPNYKRDYYFYYPMIPGSGILKDIEDLEKSSEENSKLLYKLNIENDDISYINLYLDPLIYNGNSSRTIKGGINESKVNITTGEITKGIVTNNSLANSFTYVFNWSMLENEI